MNMTLPPCMKPPTPRTPTTPRTQTTPNALTVPNKIAPNAPLVRRHGGCRPSDIYYIQCRLFKVTNDN